jgi:hypothetical protein
MYRDKHIFRPTQVGLGLGLTLALTLYSGPPRLLGTAFKGFYITLNIHSILNALDGHAPKKRLPSSQWGVPWAPPGSCPCGPPPVKVRCQHSVTAAPGSSRQGRGRASCHQECACWADACSLRSGGGGGAAEWGAGEREEGRGSSRVSQE